MVSATYSGDSPHLVKRQYARQFALAVFAIGGGAATFSIFGLMGGLGQAFELATHFYFQYFVILLVCTTVLALMKRWNAAGFLAVFLLVCAAQVAPLYFPLQTAVPADAPRLRVGQINVNTYNDQYGLVVRQIVSAAPEVICIEEANQTWLNKLDKEIGSAYPYRVEYPQGDNFSIALFSKLPLRDARICWFGGVKMPCAIGTVEVGGKAITVLAIHTLPPINPHSMQLRDQEMQGLIDRKDVLGKRFVIAGDFNCSSWSPIFQTMLKGLCARDSRNGFGVQGSWPAQSEFLRIPIDHILTSGNFVPIKRWIGDQIGSDHMPVFAEFALID